MTELTLFREYEPWECGTDGYPRIWHDGVVPRSLATMPDLPRLSADALAEMPAWGVKHIVRANAYERCERCGHPYTEGCGEWAQSGIAQPAPLPAQTGLQIASEVMPLEQARRATLWSPCDTACTHGGPLRWANPERRVWTTVIERGGTLTDAAPRTLIAAGHAVQAAWRILTVHHLNQRKHDLRWWNLAALCQRCHLVIQRKVHIEQTYPMEHTAWFKPHAAGWYAYAYHGENITREEAVERMDELLGLEHVWG